jgi:hypothetical protein
MCGLIGRCTSKSEQVWAAVGVCFLAKPVMALHWGISDGRSVGFLLRHPQFNNLMRSIGRMRRSILRLCATPIIRVGKCAPRTDRAQKYQLDSQPEYQPRPATRTNSLICWRPRLLVNFLAAQRLFCPARANAPSESKRLFSELSASNNLAPGRAMVALNATRNTCGELAKEAHVAPVPSNSLPATPICRAARSCP